MSRGQYPRTPEWRARMREIMLRRHEREKLLQTAGALEQAGAKPSAVRAVMAQSAMPEALKPDAFWAEFDHQWRRL
jgi:hypothetical protein